MSHDEWMSEKDLAAMVGKSPLSIASERSRGEDLPPFYKFGQKVRYRRSEVEAWMQQHRHLTATAKLRAAEVA